MATIHVNRGGTNLGTFSEEEVRNGLRAGRFQATDLGWREGMAAWQPLSQFTEFAADIAAAPAAGSAAPTPPPTPGNLPSSPAPVVTTPAPPPGARTGLPWENRNGRPLVTAFVETLQIVLTRPADAYTIMKREGGLGDPLLYGLIGGCLGAMVSFFFSFVLHAMGIAFGSRSIFGNYATLGFGGIAFLILVPIGVVVGLFIGSAIIHLCLMIMGGARQSFETTFRVMAFTHGSVGILQMVPFCGGVIAGIWGIVVNCIGLARAHETETWRVVCVFLALVIVCCGFGVCVAIFIPALVHSVNH
jgi:hypothetical protein